MLPIFKPSFHASNPSFLHPSTHPCIIFFHPSSVPIPSPPYFHPSFQLPLPAILQTFHPSYYPPFIHSLLSSIFPILQPIHPSVRPSNLLSLNPSFLHHPSNLPSFHLSFKPLFLPYIHPSSHLSFPHSWHPSSFLYYVLFLSLSTVLSSHTFLGFSFLCSLSPLSASFLLIIIFLINLLSSYQISFFPSLSQDQWEWCCHQAQSQDDLWEDSESSGLLFRLPLLHSGYTGPRVNKSSHLHLHQHKETPLESMREKRVLEKKVAELQSAIQEARRVGGAHSL